MQSITDIRRLASAGVAAVGLRQIAIRAIGLAGTVVLARLLLPRDFGAVAIGLTLTSVFAFVGDAGIGAGLIRRPEAPSREDLQAFLGLQVLVTLVLAVLTAVITMPLGLVGRVTALMVVALPIAAFRSPAVILFERDLRYRPLVLIELLETVVYNAWAIGTVLAGWGVWGLASAVVVRAIFGAVVMSARSPAGFMRPRLSWGRVRGLLPFGLRYQAVSAVVLVRDQGVNLGTALIGGVAVLGLWSLSFRIMQVPFLLFDSVWRVSFPAMSRLIAAGEDARPIIERGLALGGVVSGALLSVLVGSAPALVPSVFGAHWAPAAQAIPWAAAGLMFGGPVSVATAGYLYAVGDSSSVLISAIVQALAWFALAFPLLPILGVQAIGIGWMAASIGEAIVLGVRTRRHVRVGYARALGLPAAVGAAAATAGWLTASQLGPTLISAAAGALVAGVLYVVALAVLRGALLRDALRLTTRSLFALGR